MNLLLLKYIWNGKKILEVMFPVREWFKGVKRRIKERDFTTKTCNPKCNLNKKGLQPKWLKPFCAVVGVAGLLLSVVIRIWGTK